MTAWLVAACVLLSAEGAKPERVVDGVLLEADFIHRTGQFRRSGDGVLVDFALTPPATVLYLDAEADLRDVPLGTLLHFSAEGGDPLRVSAIRDDFAAYRVEEVRAGEGRLVASVNPSEKKELRADARTRFWKGQEAAKFEDLSPGDALRVNFSGDGRVAEAWAGEEAARLATGRQRARHGAFLRERGLAGRIERVEGKTLAVSLFGDREGLRLFLKDEGIDPKQWATEHRYVDAVVANEELRTYNPPVDRKRARVLSYEEDATPGLGGVRWVIEPDLLLEGFRKGRVIRLFAHPSWPVNDMPFGETLYSEAPGFRPDAIDPNLFPYRVDNGNDSLPWYRPKPGEFPPVHSHHLVVGELAKVGDAGRSGRFRADGTGELVDFTMPPYGSVLYLNAEADLGDVPIGTRCRFFLHRDDRGEFTTAAVIADEFTRLAADAFTYRLCEIRSSEGVILAAKWHARVKDEKEAMIRPPDYGRCELAVDDRTRVWKGDMRVGLRDLAVGDECLVNTSGMTATGRGVCTDIWAGVDMIQRVTEARRSKHAASLKEQGFPAWIDRVEGKTLTITLFSGRRDEFPALLNGDPGGEGVRALLADEELRPVEGPTVKFAFRGRVPADDTAGTDGSSGVRWRIEAAELPEGFRPGRILRVFKP